MNREFEQHVVVPLQRQVRRLRCYRALQGMAAVASLLILVLAVQFVVDFQLRLPRDMRAALLAGVVLVLLWGLRRRLLQPLRLPVRVEDLARFVERRFPQLDALLISGLRFHRGVVGDAASNAPALVAAVVREAESRARTLDFDGLVHGGSARRATFQLVGLLAFVAGCFALLPEKMGIWLDRNLLLRDVSWPRRTHIVLDLPDDGVLRAAIGDDVEVHGFIADGYEVPRQLTIEHVLAEGKSGTDSMTRVGARGFRTTFVRADQDFRFRVRGGDDVTDWVEVRLRPRPRITDARLTVTPPAYTRAETNTYAPGQRAVELYPGSRMEMIATASKPLHSATLMAGTRVVATPTIAGTSVNVTVEPVESVTYHFDLLDEDGLENTRPMRFSARVLEDRPPQVKLRAEGVGQIVTVQAVLPLALVFEDDLGLAEVLLTYDRARGGAGPQSIALPGFDGLARNFEHALEWPVSAADVAPGDLVTLFAQARDHDDVSGPNVGESTPLPLRIVEVEELRRELSRREQEYRRQFQRLVDRQEALRSDLLTRLARSGEPGWTDDLALLLAPLERRQRQVAAQVNMIRQQFTQVLTEMTINALDTPEVRERLEAGIIDPLTQLGARDLVETADLLRQLGRQPSEAVARQVDPAQARALRRMRLVLDNMLKWEGFQETLGMLREILRLQGELRDETQAQLEQQASELFDD